MYHRAFVAVSAMLISACMGPSEPENPNVDAPIKTAAAAHSVAMAAPDAVSATRAEAVPTGVLATRTAAAPPGAAIEDALVRLLPAMEDQSMARELRPLLYEAQRQIERNVRPAREQALDRLDAKLREIGAKQEDPDLDAVTLALAASR